MFNLIFGLSWKNTFHYIYCMLIWKHTRLCGFLSALVFNGLLCWNSVFDEGDKADRHIVCAQGDCGWWRVLNPCQYRKSTTWFCLLYSGYIWYNCPCPRPHGKLYISDGAVVGYCTYEKAEAEKGQMNSISHSSISMLCLHIKLIQIWDLLPHWHNVTPVLWYTTELQNG